MDMTKPAATAQLPQVTEPRNPGMPLDLDWVHGAQANRSAIERRAATLPGRRSVKKDYQAAWLLKAVLGIAKPLGISRYGPEQVGFLQYRPVLDNQALKEEFGYVPEKSSAEVFDLWRREAGL